MVKKFIHSICIIVILLILLTSNITLADGVDEYFKSEPNEYDILATIEEINDEESTITLKKGHTIRNATETVLPEKITVDKFRYSYNSAVADKYNTPQFGDYVIISLKKVNDSYIVQNGVYLVDTTSGNLAKIIYPIELENTVDKLKLSALAYYIRTDGERNEFEYTKNSVKTKDGQEIAAEDYLIPMEFNPLTNKPEQINDDQLTNINNESKWIIGVIIIISGMLIGYIIIILINKKIESKNR